MPKVINEVEIPDQLQQGDGKVAIYGPKILELIDKEALRNHTAYMAELNGYYIFASYDIAQMPSNSIPVIVDFTAEEAELICSVLLKSCFVVMTRAAKTPPRESLIVKLSDWKRIQHHIHADSSESEKSPKAQSNFFPALVTEIDTIPIFKAVCVKAEAFRTLDSELFNVGSWLKSTWSMSAKCIKKDTLEVCRLNNEQRDCTNMVYDPQFGERHKQSLLVCHMLRYWRRNKKRRKEMADDLTRLMNRDESISEQGMYEAMIDAAFKNPPPSDLFGLYNKLLNKVKQTCGPLRGSSVFLDPQLLCWLLSVGFPEEFAAAFQAGKSVKDLTNCINVRRKCKFPI